MTSRAAAWELINSLVSITFTSAQRAATIIHMEDLATDKR
jgi:hypothetical protein